MGFRSAEPDITGAGRAVSNELRITIQNNTKNIENSNEKNDNSENNENNTILSNDVILYKSSETAETSLVNQKEDYSGHDSDNLIHLTPAASDLTKPLFFLPPILAADHVSRDNFEHAFELIHDQIKKQSAAVASIVTAEKIVITDSAIKTLEKIQRHKILSTFIKNIHCVAEGVERVNNIPRWFLDKLNRQAFELGIPAPPSWKEALITHRAPTVFSPEKLEYILESICDRCHKQCNGYGIAVRLLCDEISLELHDSLKKDNHEEAKNKIYKTLKLLNNLDSTFRLRDADVNLKIRLQNIVKEHKITLSNYAIVKSLFSMNDIKVASENTIKKTVNIKKIIIAMMI